MKHVLLAIKSIIVVLMLGGLSGCGGDDSDISPSPPPPEKGQATLTLKLVKPSNLPDPTAHLPVVKLNNAAISFKKWGDSVPMLISVAQSYQITSDNVSFSDDKYQYSCSSDAPVISIKKNQYVSKSTPAQTITYTCKTSNPKPGPDGIFSMFVIEKVSSSAEATSDSLGLGADSSADISGATLNVMNGSQIVKSAVPFGLSKATEIPNLKEGYTLEPKSYTFTSDATTTTCKPKQTSIEVDKNKDSSSNALPILYTCVSKTPTDNSGKISIVLPKYPYSKATNKQPVTIYLTDKAGASGAKSPPISFKVDNWGGTPSTVKVQSLTPNHTYNVKVASLKIQDSGPMGTTYLFSSDTTITAPTKAGLIPKIEVTQTKTFSPESRAMFYGVCLTNTYSDCTISYDSTNKQIEVPVGQGKNPILLFNTATFKVGQDYVLSFDGSNPEALKITPSLLPGMKADDSGDIVSNIRVLASVQMQSMWVDDAINTPEKIDKYVQAIMTLVNNIEIMDHKQFDGVNLIMSTQNKFSNLHPANFQLFLNALQYKFSQENRVLQIMLSTDGAPSGSDAIKPEELIPYLTTNGQTGSSLLPAIDYFVMPDASLTWRSNLEWENQNNQVVDGIEKAYGDWYAALGNPYNRLVSALIIDYKPISYNSTSGVAAAGSDAGSDPNAFYALDYYWITGLNATIQFFLSDVKNDAQEEGFAGVYLKSNAYKSPSLISADAQVDPLDMLVYELWANLKFSGSGAGTDPGDDGKKAMQVKLINKTEQELTLNLSVDDDKVSISTPSGGDPVTGKWFYMQGYGVNRELRIMPEIMPDAFSARLNVESVNETCQPNVIANSISALIATPYIMFGDYITSTNTDDTNKLPVVNMVVSSDSSGNYQCDYSVGRVFGSANMKFNITANQGDTFLSCKKTSTDPKDAFYFSTHQEGNSTLKNTPFILVKGSEIGSGNITCRLEQLPPNAKPPKDPKACATPWFTINDPTLGFDTEQNQQPIITKIGSVDMPISFNYTSIANSNCALVGQSYVLSNNQPTIQPTKKPASNSNGNWTLYGCFKGVNLTQCDSTTP